MCQVGTTYYVTNPSGHDTDRVYTYKLIDPITLVKYCEGKINAAELRKASLKLKLAQVKQASLETQLRLAQTRIRELDQRLASVVYGLAQLGLIVTAVPRWIVKLFLSPEGRRVLDTVKVEVKVEEK